jgi:hypothetical protein
MLTHSSKIAVYERDPKSWRKRKPTHPDLPTIIEGVKSPQEIAQEKRRRRIIPLPESAVEQRTFLACRDVSVRKRLSRRGLPAT